MNDLVFLLFSTRGLCVLLFAVLQVEGIIRRRRIEDLTSKVVEVTRTEGTITTVVVAAAAAADRDVVVADTVDITTDRSNSTEDTNEG